MSTRIPDYLKPRLRLYLSLDVVGSTALKQSRLGALKEYTEQGSTGPAWFSAIQGFYFVAAEEFLNSWSEGKASSSAKDRHFGSTPEVWKTVGDEILFVKEITDHRQVAVTLKIWVDCLPKVRAFLGDHNSSLDVKATAWIAGFPFRNREVVVEKVSEQGVEKEDYYSSNARILNKYYKNKRRKSGGGLIIDYVGPSIDTGFRICHYSSPRKFVVSVDVAYLLSMTQVDGEVPKIGLHFEESANLKGVLGGRNYPIFWIDLSADSSVHRLEDKLKRREELNLGDVKEYCDAFYAEHEGFIFRPFVEGDVGGVLSKKPPWYASYQEALLANFEEKEEAPYSAGDDDAATEGETLEEGSKQEILSSFKPSAKSLTSD